MIADKRLLHLPLCEPTLIERQADINTERIVSNVVLSCLLNPLATNIKDGTVIPLVDNWEAKTNAGTHFFGAILPINNIIRCGI